MHVDPGPLTAEILTAELGSIAAGPKSGREEILFWHRGLSLSDTALGHAMFAKAISMDWNKSCACIDRNRREQGRFGMGVRILGSKRQ